MRAPILLFSMLCLSATACSAPPASAADAQPQLKVYDVPSGYGPEIKSILNGAMNFNGPDKLVGRAEMTPSGQVIVVAPAAVQDGVRDLLQSLGKTPHAAPPAVHITYWVLDGKRATAGAKPAADLSEIQAALDAIQKADGPLSFALAEKLSVSGNADESAQINGLHVKIHDRPAVLDGKVIADVDIDSTEGPARLGARVQLAPGQLLVLGQYGEPQSGVRYYVARAELTSAAP